MTCRHEPGDPNCSAYRRYASISLPATPDAENFEILEAQQVGKYLVVKVQYPNCTKCAYEGVKVMIFEATSIGALRWRRIDPHFRDPKNQPSLKEAPSPLARFPASPAGWQLAIQCAEKLLPQR